jgi:hypothetical protein
MLDSAKEKLSYISGRKSRWGSFSIKI